jgi:hypothetical protein
LKRRMTTLGDYVYGHGQQERWPLGHCATYRSINGDNMLLDEWLERLRMISA